MSQSETTSNSNSTENVMNNKILKKELGKFYTENYNHIFQGFQLPTNYRDYLFIEPFVGKGHLLHFLQDYYKVNIDNLNIEYYDLENHIEGTIVRDSIQNPPDYNRSNTFVITNPPFLALNKTKHKETFHMYGTNDLYKCFLKTIIHRNCHSGLLIIPINFWSSIRKNDILLRKMFLEKYKVTRMNIFEERVFSDTSFLVTAFHFTTRIEGDDDFCIPTFIFPCRKEMVFEISEETYWMIGGELYHLPQNDGIVISRIVENEDGTQTWPNTRLFLNGLDDGMEKRINLEYLEGSVDLYIGKESDRTYCSINIIPSIGEIEQRRLAQRFNEFLEEKRTEYHSMFLTNYRESREFARKRISFQLAYQIINFLLSN